MEPNIILAIINEAINGELTTIKHIHVIEMCEFLFTQDSNGETLLHHLAKEKATPKILVNFIFHELFGPGSKEIAKITSIKCNNEYTALDLARNSENVDLVSVITKHAQDFNSSIQSVRESLMEDKDIEMTPQEIEDHLIHIGLVEIHY